MNRILNFSKYAFTGTLIAIFAGGCFSSGDGGSLSASGSKTSTAEPNSDTSVKATSIPYGPDPEQRVINGDSRDFTNSVGLISDLFSVSDFSAEAPPTA